MRIDRWNSEKHGALDEAAVRARYPSALYQVHRRELDQPAALSGNAPVRTLVALEGSWLLETGGERSIIRPGDVVAVPAGEFGFHSGEPVTYLAVYPLPPDQVLN